MKRNHSYPFFLLICIIALPMSCVMFDKAVNKSNMQTEAYAGTSEVVVMRAKDKMGGRIGVYIDGEQTAYLSKGNTTKLIVSDGSHTVFVDWEKSEGFFNGNTIQFIAFADRTIFRVILNPEGLTLQLEGKTVLANRNSGGIGLAISKSYAVLTDSIPQDSGKAIISVVNISSQDKSQGEFVIDELTNLLVNSKKFEVVDRNNLNTIKNEQNFQLSGDVSDDSIVSIGKQLGASVVITGSIVQSGPNSYLRMRALDVKTSKILSMSSENF